MISVQNEQREKAMEHGRREFEKFKIFDDLVKVRNGFEHFQSSDLKMALRNSKELFSNTLICSRIVKL